MSACTDFFENKLVDWLFRGQVLTQPTNGYVGLLTAGTLTVQIDN